MVDEIFMHMVPSDTFCSRENEPKLTYPHKISGCEHEDGSGWCIKTGRNTCEEAVELKDGSVACDAAL